MEQAKTYPIMLAHGLARFDVISNGILQIDNRSPHDHLHYFRNIRSHLRRAGFQVRHSQVDWAGSLRKRALDLKREVEKTLAVYRSDRVHIIGHSMGGLDARCMLFDFRREAFHTKVASVSTIGTPHHGSSFAGFLLENFGSQLDRFGMALAGVRDLTPESMQRFNEVVGPFEITCGVRFRTYAGQQDLLYVFSPLKISWQVINKAEGPNDGLVSVASAKWQDTYFVPPVWNADHLNEVGWWDVSELWQWVQRQDLEAQVKDRYLDMAEDLARAFPL